MTVVNPASNTQVAEIAPNIFRISTPVPPSAIPGGFSFNQILVVDERPLLFHTGPRKMFALVHQAVAHVLGDAKKLRYMSFSHTEADECGSMNEWLAAAPDLEVVCGSVAAMVSANDLADRPPRALADGEELSLGSKKVRWLDAPHVPHRDAHDAVRRSLHPRRPRHRRAHRVGNPRSIGGLPQNDGLRVPRQKHASHPREARAPRADHAGMHARKLVSRRRRQAAARARRCHGSVTW